MTGGNIYHFLQTSLNDGGNVLIGLLLMVIGAVGWGVYGLWGKRHTSAEFCVVEGSVAEFDRWEGTLSSSRCP